MLRQFNRRSFLGLACSLMAVPAFAAGYPNKPVRLVVPYAAGGPIDVLARALATELGKLWSQSVIVENRPGANEIIGAAYLAKAAPDGYTFMLNGSSTLSGNRYLFRELPYNPDTDFTPVTIIATTFMALVASNKLPAQTLHEFVEYAKQHPDTIPYGSSGAGNVTQLVMEAFAQDNGLKLLHVPYKGLAPIMQDLIAGRVLLTFGAAGSVAPLVHNGELRALATGGRQRVAILPDVPTFEEAGYADPGSSFFTGLLAPAGTPSDLVHKVAADIAKIVGNPEFAARNFTPVGSIGGGITPEAYKAFLEKDRALAERRIKLTGLTPQ